MNLLKNKKKILILSFNFLAQFFSINETCASRQQEVEIGIKKIRPLPPIPLTVVKIREVTERQIEIPMVENSNIQNITNLPPKNRKSLSQVLSKKGTPTSRNDLPSIEANFKCFSEEISRGFSILESKMGENNEYLLGRIQDLEDKLNQKSFESEESFSNNQAFVKPQKGYFAKFKNIMNYICCRGNEDEFIDDELGLPQNYGAVRYKEETCMDDCVRVDACFNCNERILKYILVGAVVGGTAYGVYTVAPYVQAAVTVINVGADIFTNIAEGLGITAEELIHGVSQTVENVTITVTKFSIENEIDITSQGAINTAVTGLHSVLGNVSNVLVDTFLGLGDVGNVLGDLATGIVNLDTGIQSVSDLVYELCLSTGPCKCAVICECIFLTFDCM